MTANSVERGNLAVSVQVPLGLPDWHLGKENCHRRISKGRGQELEQAPEILWQDSTEEGCREISDSMIHRKEQKVERKAREACLILTFSSFPLASKSQVGLEGWLSVWEYWPLLQRI